MKKVLTILLSVFMMVGVFTTRVFAAETKTISEIAPEDFPTGTSTYWINENLIRINISDEGDKLCFNGSTEIGNNHFVNQTVTKNASNNYEYYCTFGDDNITIEFVMNGDTFDSLSVSGFNGDKTTYNGTYKTPLTVGDLIDKAKYSIINSQWYDVSRNYSLTYDSISERFSLWDYTTIRQYTIENPLSNKVTVNANNKYEFTYNDLTFEFILENDVLTSINVSGAITQSFYPIAYLNDVLQIFDENWEPTGKFPTSVDEAWINENNKTLYYDSNISYLCNDGNTVYFGNVILKKNSNGNYETTDSYNSINMEICVNNDGSVSSLIITGYTNDKADLNGEYAPKPITIADILDTVDGGFPTFTDSIPTNAWLNEHDKKMYIKTGSKDLLMYGDNAYFLDAILSPSDLGYVFNDGQGLVIKFIMNDNVLQEVTVTYTSPGDMYGTYLPNNTTYEVTDGKQISVDINKGENVTFTSKADFSRFVGVKVDGVTIDPSNYTAVSGSTKVTVKASYLNTLSAGNHTIEIVSNNGSASTTFTIVKNDTPSPEPTYVVPNTGVEGTPNIHSLLKLSSLSLLTVGTYLVIKKKKDNN